MVQPVTRLLTGSDPRLADNAKQTWRADDYAKDARFVSDYGLSLVDLLAPQKGEHILDLGCGEGALTQVLANAGADVMGVDASLDMINATKARGLDAQVVDGEALLFNQEFDAVFSNAAMHWMTRPDAVIAGVQRALKPGGRFVAEMGGHGNVAAIRTAITAVLSTDYAIEADLKNIWYFPSVSEHQLRLENAGFIIDEIQLFARPTPLKAGMERWLKILSAPALVLVPESERVAARQKIAKLVAPALQQQNGDWIGDYVRLRFSARLSEVTI